MSLFRRHKKFEEQLNEQLGDMEVKPSASLWDRIDSGITSDSFESGVQSSLENFEQMPYPETWDKIAAQLPEARVGSGLTKYFIGATLVVLFSAGLYIGRNLQPEAPELAQREPVPAQKMPGEAVYAEQLASKNAGTPALNEADPDARISPAEEIAGTPTTEPVSGRTATRAVTRRPDPIGQDERRDIAAPKTIVNATGVSDQNEPAVQSVDADGSVNNGNEVVAIADGQPAAAKTATADGPVANEASGTIPAQQAGNTSPANENGIGRDGGAVPAVAVQEPAVVAVVTPPVFNQPREVVEVKPDSAVYAQKMQSYGEQPKADEFSPVSISVIAGMQLSFTTYSAPKQPSTLNFEKNIALREELERPDIDWAGGFLIDYRINRKWMISSGIAMVNFSQKFEYDIEPSQDPDMKNEAGVPVTNPGDSFIVGNQYSNRISYSWTEVPVYVNYTLVQKNRWNIDVQGGMSYAFINTIDGGMIGYDNKGVLVLKGKESFPNIRNTVFVTAMPQVSYQFTPSVSVGIVPSFKYSLTSIIGNEYWIQQHPYFFGMNICLRKRF